MRTFHLLPQTELRPDNEVVPRLELFQSADRSSGPGPCIIVCPGGGYTWRAPHEGGQVAQWLNALGLAVAVLQYRVAPHRHPAPLQDAQRAIRLLRSQAESLQIDPNRIGILGFSAGGHLATSAAVFFDNGRPDAADPIDRASSRPDALIACYPVITFGEHRHDGSMQNLLGPDAPAELKSKMSLETQVKPDSPPTFLWHTADDASVPVENSLLFAAALRRHRIPFELHIFPHGRHGLGLAHELPHVHQWTHLCARWLTAIGFHPAR
jgi:acetyl esterase/lipase